MSSFPSLEYRSLKRKEHCPPDVYCQRSEQKEDLMCEDFVKDGFKYTKPVRDEYESCKEESRFLNSDAVWSFYYNVMLKKYECSNFQDFKKRQTTNIRDTVIPAIDMYKEQVCDWFRELSSNVPLQNLGRRVPFFKDKEEILHELLSNKVPITRALWFINISVIQSTAVAETAKKKPRAPQDPTADWSSTLCRLLSRSLEPIYAPVKHNELISLFNDWDYLFSLLLAMYDSDMADHWEVILWLIKVAESVNEQIRGQSSPSTVALSPSDRSALTSKCASDFPLKFILHYLIKFGRRFTESELLIRRLLYWCCTTFADVVFACTGSKYASSVGTLQSILNEYKDLCTCPLHQSISMSLSSLIIFIVLSCPSAAVWNPIPFDTDYAYFKGSPLDHIPHSLVALPLPLGEESTSIRKCLSEVEEDIIRRSQLVESGWLIEPCSGNNGENIERLVRLLDILDRHEYHLVREPNPMESLYNRIFNDDSIHVDTAIIVITLCEWAVSPYRIGIYRSIIVACLLEQLKNTFYGDNSINSSNIINKDTVSLSTAPVNTVSTTGSNVNGVTTTMTAVTTTATTTTTTTANTTSVKNTTNINNMNIMSSQAYQSLQETLIKFLDNCTAHLPPFNGEQSLIENNLMRNLVCLFSELIDREVFDHDNYVRYFIARGVFDTSLHPLALIDNTMQNKMNTNPFSINNNNNNNNTINQSVNTPTNITRTTTGGTNMSTASVTCHSQTTAQHSVKSEFSEDMDRYSMDNPDSVRSESGIMNLMSLQSNNQPINHQSFSSSSSLSNNQGITNSNRHLHYLVQFPIPQDESYAHEQNQRFQLLYGSVRSRDRARYPIRKLIRDICKLFTKKIYLIDVFHGELGRRKRSKDREREKDVNNNNNTANNNNINSNNLGTTLGLGSLVGQSTTSTGTGTSNNGSNIIGNGSNHRSVSNNNSNDETRSIDEVHEDITKRFINLSFYDMEYVLSQCTPVFVKMLSGSNFHSTVNASNDDNNSNSNITSINTNSPLSSSSSTNTQNTTTTISSSSNSFVTTVSNNNNNPLSMTTSNTQSHIYMPVPSSIFLFFELIETSLNITSLILTIIDTLERLKILFENRTHFMTLYMSSLCLRSVGILQRYQNILFTMGDISCRLFPTLIEQVRQVKEPTQCGPLERCILIYLNDLFTSNIVIKTRFTPIYGKAHQKVNALLRRIDPNDGIGQFDPDYANDLITITSMDNVTSFRAYADDLRNKPDSRYSFVCKAIIWICQAKTIEHVNYLCGLCAELTSQCSELTPEWLGAFYAILAPHSYVHGYSPLINTIDPSQIWIYDNLSSLIGTLLSRYCFTISDFLRLVICPAMAQGLDNVTQPVSVQLKSIISLACHILHCLFTAESTVSSLQTTSNVLTPNPDMNLSNTTTTTTTTNTTDNLSNSPTSPPFRISEPLLLTAALQKVTSEFLVDVLKMLIVHSDKASVDNNNNTGFCSQEDIIDETDNGTGNDDNNEDSDANQDDDGGDEEHDDENDDNDGGGTLNTRDNLDDLTDIDSEGDNSILRNTTRKRTRTILQQHQKDNNKSKRFKSRHNRRHINRKSISKIHYIIQRFLEHDILPTTIELRTLPLNALTQLVLREICTISWVRERFYQMTSNQLIRENVLIDKNFTQSQARRLLHIIYWPYDITWIDIASTNEGLSGAMCHILHNLNIWTLKCTQIEFQLLYSQISFSQQTEVLGYLAQSIVHGFQSQIINWLDYNNNNTTVSMTSNNNNNITTTTTSNNNNTNNNANNSNYMNFQEGSIGHLIDDLPIIELDDNDPVWLFPALIAKLPKSLKAQIVKVTSEILKGIKNFWKHKNDEDKESILLHHSILLTHPTFFSLLQICLPDSDFIIDSLYEQIEYFLLNSRHLIDHVPENLHTRQIIQNCLKYRLILIGQKFHIIQLDIDMTIRWITLLTQLISYGIIEPESNSILFYIVYDMLQILIHTLTARTGIEGKHYQMIAKKLRRELLEHPSNTGIEYIRPLLLLTKNSYTIFVTGRQLRHHGLRGGLSNMSSGTLGTSTSSGGGTGSGGGGIGIGSSGINNNNSSNKLSNSKGSGKAENCLLTGASRFLTSSSSNSILQSGGVSQFKRHGYQLLGKERFNPWEIYDPSKQPLLLSIHGAINTESILSRIEEQANRLIRHDHFHRMYRPPEFYMIPIYPQSFDEDIPMNHVKLCDVGEHDNSDIIKMIKTENSNNNNDTTNSITNSTSISSIYNKNHNSNSMDVMRESQILSLNDMTQLSETNLSECSNQFLSIKGSNNNNINIRSGDSNSNYHQSTSGVLYDQKHNISSISCHSTNNLMFNESNSSIKSVNQIDCGNTNMMMSMMMMTTSSGSTTVDTATNNSNSMQIGRGKLLNTRNDIEINDKLSLNNHINAFQPSSSGSLGGGTVGGGIGVVSSSSSSLQIHSHPQQIHGHHHHQQQQMHLNSDQAYTNPTRKLPSQQTVLNDYSNPNELDQRSMNNVNHCVTVAGHMNTITYPLSHHHNHQMDVNLHKTNKLLGMEYNDRLIASQSSTSSQQQIQINPTGTSSIPPPSNNASMLSTPMNNSVVAGHVLTSAAKTATTTTKRKRGSGRRGGGGNITSDRNSIRPSGATTRGGMHTTGSVNVVGYERMNNNSTNNSSVNLYSYNIINPEQQVNESNHQWTNKQNVYNMNLLEMQQQQPPSSTRGHHQQQHLANLSGFLRNRAQQHQQQQQLHPEQSYGSSFSANNPVVLSHQGHVFDQSQLSSHFNQSNTHLVDSPSGSLRRHLTTSGGGAGTVARSMQQSSQQQSHQILSHPTGTPQQLPPGMPNPPPYPISNQSQQYSFRAPPSDEANYMMNTNESSIDEQYKRQSINSVMNSIHQSGTTIMSRSSTYESPASHLQTDIPSQQHMSYIPSQVDTPLNQSRIHSRIINQSQSNQMIRSDITPTTVINTGSNNNNNQPSHMSNLPHSSYSRYTGY
ncbi:unnamed protein product [Schistosoma margrebowiei]|uniref:Mediator complex subunit Med12 domain-containing protein n=1 Tax=Schistosoma margrebowiei TaxID=48269 RepID=A0AA85A007_9TREM|nr:unnamed protein product [Schistosoma margrebowiei]